MAWGIPAETGRLREQLSRETGVRVDLHDADLRHPPEVARLMADTEQMLGPINILINYAGVQFVAPVAEFPPERWLEIQNINLHANFLTILAAVPGMRQRQWARIINIVSAHGLVASSLKIAYVAAKHRQVGLTKALALELAEAGITCIAICPWYVRIPTVENQIEAQAKAHHLPRERIIKEIIFAGPTHPALRRGGGGRRPRPVPVWRTGPLDHRGRLADRRRLDRGKRPVRKANRAAIKARGERRPYIKEAKRTGVIAKGPRLYPEHIF